MANKRQQPKGKAPKKNSASGEGSEYTERESIRKVHASSNWATAADKNFLIDGLFQFFSIPFQTNSFHSVTLKLRKNKKIKKQIKTRVQEAQELGECISSSPRSWNEDSELGNRTGSLIRDREEKRNSRPNHPDRPPDRFSYNGR
jgi:hypothetical protein